LIKKGDFIELDYTGRIKDDKVVFDTTSADTAKASDIFSSKYNYKPVIICVGEKHVVAGLDEAIIGKNPGKYTIEVKAEHAFGKKTAELLKLIPMKLFTKDEVRPFVGLEVNVDGTLGIVRNVSGGRVIVDFNHPLSGRDLIYDIDIKREVTDPVEKVKSILDLLGMVFDDIDILDDKATITSKVKLPEEPAKELGETIQKLAGLKSVEFKTDSEASKQNLAAPEKPGFSEAKKELKEEIKTESKKDSESSKAKPLSAKDESLSTSTELKKKAEEKPSPAPNHKKPGKAQKKDL
jgi:FKBP-type peptidyl-prolyl cis-trans isomerase 2